MKKFKFLGKSLQRFSILHNGRTLEYCLDPNSTTSIHLMPAENARIKQLIAKNLIVEVGVKDEPIQPKISEIKTSVKETEKEVSDSETSVSTAGNDDPNVEMVDFKVTKKFLKDHPELKEKGVKVGETIQYPKSKA
jgi:hypothetical protein